MSFILDQHSIKNVQGVHKDLIRVIDRCTTDWTEKFVFGITQGLRTIAQQQKYVNAGRSTTLHSRHLTGHAVDVVALLPPDNEVSWTWHLYDTIAVAMKAAAKDVDVPIEWGGDWTTFKDGAHFQLPWAQYPIP